MKILYFDCSSGISGNMTLGALTEIIGDENYLLNELKKLNIDGYKIEISKKIKNGITGTYVDVILDNEHTLDHHTDLHEHHHEHNHSSSHEHHHEHRNLEDVNKIIENSSLNNDVKKKKKKIFLRVAEAESKVHNKTLDEVQEYICNINSYEATMEVTINSNKNTNKYKIKQTHDENEYI